MQPSPPAPPATSGKTGPSGRKQRVLPKSTDDRGGRLAQGPAKDTTGMAKSSSIDMVPDAEIDAVMSGTDATLDKSRRHSSKRKIFGGTKVKQGAWRVKGAHAKISGTPAFRPRFMHIRTSLSRHPTVVWMTAGQEIANSVSARKQKWVVGRIMADVDSNGRVRFKYSTPKNETKEEQVLAAHLEEPSPEQVKSFQSRTLNFVAGQNDLKKQQVSAYKGNIMKLSQKFLDTERPLDRMSRTGYQVGVVVQNPDPDIVLQWENGEESDLLAPADLVEATEKEILRFKQSLGYRRYLEKNTRVMKEEVNANNQTNLENRYWGPGMMAKFEAKQGVWKTGRVLNDPTKGLLGEELQFDEMHDSKPRQVTRGEVQLLMTDGELSAPIRLSLLKEVDSVEESRFYERLRRTYDSQRNDNDDPEKLLLKLQQLKETKKEENKKLPIYTNRQQLSLDPEEAKIAMLADGTMQHGLDRCDLICSTDVRPWDKLEQVPESHLFLVLNIPQRLASAEKLCAALNGAGCYTSTRHRIYQSMTVYTHLNAKHTYAILQYKQDPAKQRPYPSQTGKRIHSPVDLLRKGFSITDDNGSELKIVGCKRWSMVRGPFKTEISDDITRRLNMRPEKVHPCKQACPCPLPYEPTSPQRTIWNAVLFMLCIYVAVSVPVQVFFMTDDHIFFFQTSPSVAGLVDTAIDLAFVLDILLNFRTAYYDADNHLVRDGKMIAKQYGKSWFVVDALSILPAVTSFAAARMFKVFRIVRLLKLLRVLHMRKLFSKLMVTGFMPLDNLLAFVMKWQKPCSLLAGTLYLAHFLACVWFFIGIELSKAPKSDTGPNSPELPLPSWHPPADYEVGRDSWIGVAVGNGHMPGNQPDLWTKYVASFYWAITVLSTVGYGDIFPITNLEKGFSIMVQLLGCMVFGTLTGALASHNVNATRAGEKVREEMEFLQEYFNIHQIPFELQEKVKRIAAYKYRKSAVNEAEMLDGLPSSIQRELRDASSGGDRHIYERLPLLCDAFQGSHTDSNLENAILHQMKRGAYQNTNDCGLSIYKEGDRDREIYFVIKGQVRLSSVKSDTQYIIDEGSFFGERELFFERRFDGTYNALSEAALERGIDIDGRPRQHTAKVVSPGVAEVLYVGWTDILQWTDLGKDKNSLIGKQNGKPVKQGELMLEKLRAKAAERVLQDDNFMIQRSRDRFAVIDPSKTSLKYEALRRHLCIPINQWVDAVYKQRMNLELAGSERARRKEALMQKKEIYRMAKDKNAKEDDQLKAKEFAACHIQKAWRKQHVRGTAAQKPDDLKDLIESETARVERRLDSVRSEMSDKSEQLEGCIIEQFQKVMQYVEDNAADTKNDVEVRNA